LRLCHSDTTIFFDTNCRVRLRLPATILENDATLPNFGLSGTHPVERLKTCCQNGATGCVVDVEVGGNTDAGLTTNTTKEGGING